MPANNAAPATRKTAPQAPAASKKAAPGNKAAAPARSEQAPKGAKAPATKSGKAAPAKAAPATKTAKAAPAKAAPATKAAKSAPAKAAPAKTPAKAAPAKATPAKKSAKASPAKSTPAKTPAKAAPAKSTPAKTSAKAAPARSTPARNTAKASPAKSAPAKTPAKAAPAGKTAASARSAPAAKTAKAAPARAARPAPARDTAAPAPARPVAPRTAAPSASERAYTLAQLVDRHGGPDGTTEAQVFARVGAGRAELAALGAQVATARISTEAARIYGQVSDFWPGASAAQRQALRGFSDTLLRLCVWSAWQGDRLWTARDQEQTAARAQQGTRVTTADGVRSHALTLRDQWRTTLRMVSGGAPVLDDAIAAAYGTLETPGRLAEAIRRLAALGEAWQRDKALAPRCSDAGIDAAFVADTRAFAATIEPTLTAGQAVRESPRVAQAEVDLWDGVNLLLLDRVLDLFAVATRLDPMVPRLQPISLRNWFSPQRPKKPAGTPKPGSEPKDPGATG